MKRIYLLTLVAMVCLGVSLLVSCDDDDDSGLPADDDTGDDDAEDDDTSDDDTDDDAADDDDATLDDDDDDDDTVFYPAEDAGPYNVGAFPFFYQYPDKARTLPAMVWYPTNAQTGETMRYMFGLVRDVGAFKNATPAQGPFPLIVFSHGSQSINFQSFTFIDHLVSHGYIVAACDHVQNGLLTYLDPDLLTKYFTKSALDRPQDISALIDTMLAKNEDENDRLYGRIDPDRIGMFGHSYGGYTTFADLGGTIDIQNYIELCEEIGPPNWPGACSVLMNSDLSYADDCSPCTLGDERIKVAVPMAPAYPDFFPPGGLEDIEIPTLIMAGELDDITPPQTQNHLYFEGMTDSRTLFWELAGASHITFSSGCEIPIVRQFLTCTEEYIEQSIATPLIRTALTAFFGLHLLGNDRYAYYFEDDYLQTVPEITLETK